MTNIFLPRVRISRRAVLPAMAMLIWLAVAVASWAQESTATPQTDGAAVVQPTPAGTGGMNFFSLLTRGGFLMWPLLALSIFVVALAIERLIALRKERILPGKLVYELSRQADAPGGFDPRQAFRLCQTFPSSAARILRSMLLKVGRPQGEIEHAVGEAVQREANRLQSAVSWLGLAAAVAPLIGLLGTVWGITQAFFDYAQYSTSQNRTSAASPGNLHGVGHHAGRFVHRDPGCGIGPLF